MKKALITGITGQDGTYLTELLLQKGYEVHGIIRKASLINTHRIDHLYSNPHDSIKKMILHYGDLSDSSNIIRIIQKVQPDEIYNLGAMSHVQVSFQQPEYVANIDGIGILRILEAIRILGMEKKTKIYQAATSEMFGKVQQCPQTEITPFYPRSPYGVAKLFAYWIIINYREAYNIFACNGILFNHESPVRGETFVTRKITRAIAEIVLGLKKKFWLGNLDAQRDWGHAKDYVRAMWLMLQQQGPSDYIIATGNTFSVREFCIRAFRQAGVVIFFRGSGTSEIGIVENSIPGNQVKSGDTVIEIDKRYFRPTEVDLLKGDATKARNELGWEPQYTLDSMISEMISSDIKLFSKKFHLSHLGYPQNNNYE